MLHSLISPYISYLHLCLGWEVVARVCQGVWWSGQGESRSTNVKITVNIDSSRSFPDGNNGWDRFGSSFFGGICY